jgi:hypothetical protein
VVRISVGLDDVRDVIADFAQALAGVASATDERELAAAVSGPSAPVH